MFKKLLTYHQVMPSLLSFVLQWGKQAQVQSSFFLSLKSQCSLSFKEPRWCIPSLGRSGFGYEYAFSLKSAETSSSHHDWNYSLRPITAYHSFDVRHGRAVWIFIRGDNLILKRVRETTRSPVGLEAPTGLEDAFEHSLRLNLLICECALENWQQYLQYMDEKVTGILHTTLREPLRPNRRSNLQAEGNAFDEPMTPKATVLRALRRMLSSSAQEEKLQLAANCMSNIAKVSLASDESLDQPPKVQDLDTFDEVNDLHSLESHAKDAERTVMANAKVLSDLCQFYESAWNHPDFSSPIKNGCRSDFEGFQSRLSSCAAEFEALQTSLGHLLEQVDRRKTHAYNIISWNSMQASHLLTRKAQASTESSLLLTKATLCYTQVTASEEKMMKVVTLVTLFFLPGTFISTLMSTDIIKFSNNEGSYSPKALGLFFTLCVPLMAVTFIVTGFVYWWAQIRARAQLSHVWPITSKTENMV